MLFVMTSSFFLMSVAMTVMMSSVTVRIVSVTMSMPVAVIMVVRGSNRDLEVVPSQIGENSVLDVAPQITFLGKRVPVLLGIHSPPTYIVS